MFSVPRARQFSPRVTKVSPGCWLVGDKDSLKPLLGDPPTQNEIRALRDVVKDFFRARSEPAGGSGPLLVVGGTVRALARLLAPRRASAHGAMLRAMDVAHVRELLERMSVAEKRALPGLKPDRADTILAGAIVLEELLIHGEHKALVVSSTSVREGVLHREAVRMAGAASVFGERALNRSLPPVGLESFRSEAR